jgi:hypothetical protein
MGREKQLPAPFVFFERLPLENILDSVNIGLLQMGG